MIDTLIELGFSRNDAIVYSALVEAGPCFVAPLVRITKKHRQVVYNALTSLIERHVVTVAEKNGKNFYSVADSQRLLADIKQKEVLATSVVKLIEQKKKHAEEQVEVFAGSSSHEQGAADFRRRAREAKEYMVIRGETKGWFEDFRPFYPEHIDELRSMRREGTGISMIFFEYERDIALKFMGEYLGDPYICKIAPDEYKLPHTAWIAGDHIYFVTPAIDPLVIHIKSKPLATQYKEFFWKVWKKGEILKKRTK